MHEPWKGGKGRRAPYETTHIRIPAPTEAAVKAISDEYKQLAATGAADIVKLELIARVEAAIHCNDSAIPVTKYQEQLTQCREANDALVTENQRLVCENVRLAQELKALQDQLVSVQNQLTVQPAQVEHLNQRVSEGQQEIERLRAYPVLLDKVKGRFKALYQNIDSRRKGFQKNSFSQGLKVLDDIYDFLGLDD